MNLWYYALVVGFGTMVCFAGAIPLYFRKGTTTPGKTWMLAGILVCGTAQGVALVGAKEVPLPWRVGGLAMFAVAHLVFWAAIAAHGRERPWVAFASDSPNRLVRTGPYRWVRHPFYIAYTVAWLAGAVVTTNAWLTLTAGLMVFVYRTAAVAEEAQFLSSDFADDYRDYQRRTGMLLPRFVVAGSGTLRSRPHDPGHQPESAAKTAGE